MQLDSPSRGSNGSFACVGLNFYRDCTGGHEVPAETTAQASPPHTEHNVTAALTRC